jgi:hypothetical protein
MLVVIFSLVMCIIGFAIIYMNGLEYLAVRQDYMDEKATFAMEAGMEMGREFLYYCDARLESKDDLDITFGPSASAYTKNISDAMNSSVTHWGGVKDSLQLFNGPVVFDTSWPSASCEVWISSANYNTKISTGVYEYRITSRGRSTYGFKGALDSVVDGTVIIQISSVTDTAYHSWPKCNSKWCDNKGIEHLPDATNMPLTPASKGTTRYYFKYFRDSGRGEVDKPPVREVVY